jgi:capsular exopolysaccharide synthesis family protein
LPELGVIPSAAAAVRLDGRARALNILGARGSEAAVELLSLDRPLSPVSEAYRASIVSILTGNGNGSPLVLAITSAGRGDGKTTTLCNLGIALAHIGKRVLLIDADLRRPRLHSVFHLPNDPGLAQVLTSRPLESAVQTTKVPGLSILTSGAESPEALFLLHSDRVGRVLSSARNDYDTVLIDTPPVLELADARVVGQYADAAILVCRAGATSRDSAAGAAQRLQWDRIPVLGTILNDWDPKNAGSYYPSYSYRRA